MYSFFSRQPISVHLRDAKLDLYHLILHPKYMCGLGKIMHDDMMNEVALQC